MIYCSIDIETTGLDIEHCDIIEFAAVIDDLTDRKPLEELPRFHTYIAKRSLKGEPCALSMHPHIFRKIANADFKTIDQEGCWISEGNERYMRIDQLPLYFKWFLEKNLPESLIHYTEQKTCQIKKLNIAGKNVSGFDIPFLKNKIKNWHGLSFSQRVLDPAILYFEPGDLNLPDSLTCMKRAEIEGEVAHNAMEDALMVIKLLRHKIVPLNDK